MQFRPLAETKFINDANLVSYWKLDGNSNDSKGSNNGTDTGISYVAGKYGQAASFTNGSTSTIVVNNNLGIDGGNITFSTNIQLVSEVSSGTEYYFFSQYSANSHVGYMIQYDYNGGTRRLGFSRLKSGVSQDRFYYNVSLGTSLHNIILTFNGSTLSGYLDGAFIGSFSSSGNGASGLTNQFNIYGINNGTIQDDAAVFNRSFNSAEANELYQGMTLGEYLPNSNTKLLLHLNGNSTDSSGNGNNGTDTAITYSQANGKFGMGAGFNGSSSKIIINNSLTGGFSQLTFSAWVYLTGSLADYPAIMGRATTSSNTQLRLYNDGRLSFLCYTTSDIEKRDGDILSTNTWYHVGATYDGSNMRTFINGKEQGTPIARTGTISSPSTEFAIGRINNGSTIYSYWPGNIEEAIVESIAWTPQQVAKYYSFAKARFSIL